MALSEKIVREAFAKNGVKALEAHLRAIEVDNDDVAALVALLKRGCLPLFEYPNPKREKQRADWIAAIVTVVEERRDKETADQVRSVLDLFVLIESGYRAIVGDLAGLAVSGFAPARRVSALLDLSAERRNLIRTASADAIIIDGMIDPLGLGIDDGHGHSISPDVPIDVDVMTMTMALKMEGFRRDGFNAQDQLVLPDRVVTSDEEREAARELLVAAQAWRHWTRMQEETRYFDGTLKDLPAEDLPEIYRAAGVRRLLHHDPGANEWHAIDLAANERLLLRMKQQSAQMMFGTNAAQVASGISGRVELFPKAFVNAEELQSAQALDLALSAEIGSDKSLYRGLRFVEWIRGYAVLQEMVSDAFEASAHDPARLIVELPRAELVRRLQRLGLAGAKADTFVTLATFDKSTRDLFDTPLVRMGSDAMLIFGPAMLGAIPAQTTLSRLASLKQSLEVRGKAFERAMLAFMKEQGLDAATKKAKRGGEEYEYDLLVRWDGRIFLFECKSRSLSGNNLIASYYDLLEIGSQVQQVRRLVEGLEKYPDILDEVFGEGASALEVVPCVLSALPMSLPEPIDGVYFTDASALTRLFHSPTFNMSAARRQGEGGGPEIVNVPTHRLWAGSEICGDDLMRQLQSPIQLKLMLQQLSATPSGGWLAEGVLATTTRIFHQPVPTGKIAEMLRC